MTDQYYIGFAEGGTVDFHPIGESVELHESDCAPIWPRPQLEYGGTVELGEVEVSQELQAEFDKLREIKDALADVLAKQGLVHLTTEDEVRKVIERTEEKDG